MRIKSVPEDFFVRELISLDVRDSGKYLYFLLKKCDLTTLEALSRIAKWLRIPVKSIGYAGLKDRRAVTEQFCSVSRVSRDRLERVSLAGIDVEFVGYGDSPIYRGQNDGNFFRIVVRGAVVPRPRARFVNFFGEQRFSRQNVDVGRAIVKKDFRKACELLKVESLAAVSAKLLRLYVHAYQSFLWNKAAELWSEKTSDDLKLPIVGFGTEAVDDITKSVLDEEGITARDFVIRELSDVSAEGGVRDLYAVAGDLRIEERGDGVVLEFSLPSGSYATEFVRQLFG